MSAKLEKVSELLDRLIKTYTIVYVHCTAGVYRSPQTVIGYYCLYKKMEVNEAILLVEKKHPISKKNRDYLKNVMNMLLNK